MHCKLSVNKFTEYQQKTNMVRHLSILVATFFFAQSCAKPWERIVNGTDAQLGEFPYIVSLRRYNVPMCGGSIINDRCVLTAAHCVYNTNPQLLSIQYGVVKTNSLVNIINVVDIIIHGDYKNTMLDGLANDVAILKLAAPIKFSNVVAPVKLPQQGQQFKDWSTTVVAGWGVPYTGGPHMNHLQKVNLFLYPDDYCESILQPSTHREYHLCAGVPEGGKAECNGDSGGPLIVEGVQAGIVSWSDKPCGLVRKPDVHTRVANYVKWILKKCSK
ncbi:polyserase-related [Holotrichia oblita]|uniref:Polyserase-related n=2 Tax=Holotrichia oblita TaxID=644536 RepID=A0ACB9TYA4_HOLOL|nr:polyserase-related [Holotrichia oblita]KAI4471758.1 polyserase-related [Holotrichia oblita]